MVDRADWGVRIWIRKLNNNKRAHKIYRDVVTERINLGNMGVNRVDLGVNMVEFSNTVSW